MNIVGHLGYDYEFVKRQTNEMINSMVEADNTPDIWPVEIHVPKFNSSDNFPLALYGAERVSITLYNHGVTRHKVLCEFVPDETMNPD